MQADSAVGVAGDLLTPAVSFVDDRAQLLDRERGLGDQIAILPDPGTMRDVALDPVSAMIELLACRFAGLYRSVDNLGAFGQVEFGSVALQRITAGGLR